MFATTLSKLMARHCALLKDCRVQYDFHICKKAILAAHWHRFFVHSYKALMQGINYAAELINDYVYNELNFCFY